jgi:hypothetical protein
MEGQCKWGNSMPKLPRPLPMVIVGFDCERIPGLDMITVIPRGVGTDLILPHDWKSEMMCLHSASKAECWLSMDMKELNPRSFLRASLS